MVDLFKDETIFNMWTNYFEEQCKSNIETVAINNEPSLYIDYDELDSINQNLSDGLLKEPSKYLFNANLAIKDIDTAVGHINPQIRLLNLPNICNIPVNGIRQKHIGKLYSLSGLVTKIIAIRVKITMAAFQCQKCGAILTIRQEDENILKEPAWCDKQQGGCGAKTTSFKFLPTRSEKKDFQKIQLEESYEGLAAGVQPTTIDAHLLDDLTGMVNPGDRIILNGIPFLSERKSGQSLQNIFDIKIHVESIEIQERHAQKVRLSPDDVELIENTSKDAFIYDKFEKSISPSIFGLEIEKRALLLQLFSGMPKQLLDGTTIRSDIHILLIGDPGVAKSQLLSFIARLSPSSIYCDGKGSSAAGLTAAVKKDAFGEGQFVLEAGALVLADGGIACVDELDKMDKSDREALHAAMEQQKVRISKAGINATLNTRCSLLASANPQLGRFDSILPIPDQITLPVTLLSRFDLIFPIIDRPNPEKDKQLSDHIGKIRKTGGKSILEPTYPYDFLKKYISYAKTIEPKQTDASISKINAFYLELRKQEASENIAITPRQLESLYRLSEASARIRLSNRVISSDAERAIEIFHHFLTAVGMDRETNKFDIDIITTGKSHSQYERMRNLLEIIQRLADTHGSAAKSEILSEAEILGIESNKIEEILKKLKREGQILEVTYDCFKLV